MQQSKYDVAVPLSARRCRRVGTQAKDHSEDFMMPDYIPDIRRIAYCDVKGEVQMLSCEDGRISWECLLTYTALLLGDDGTLRNVVLQSSVDGEIKTEGEYEEPRLEVKLENSGMRALDPRRMNGRCRVLISAYAPCRVSTAPKLNGEGEAGAYIEKKTERTAYTVLAKVERDDIRVSRDIELDSSMPEISDIVYCDVRPYLTSCAAKDGHADIRGEAAVELLYSDSDGRYFSHSSRVPISESFEIPYSDVRASFGTARIGQIKASAQANSYGENKLVELDFSWGADLLCAIDDECEITTDLYSTAHELSLVEREVVLERCNGAFGGNLSISGEQSLEDLSMPDACSVAAVRGNARVNEIIRNDNGRLCICGNAEISVVCALGGEKEGYATAEMKIPFKYEREIEGIGEGFDCRCVVNIVDIKNRLDRSKLRLDCELTVSAIVTSPFSKKGIAEVNVKGELSQDRAPMTLCFNCGGDDLWAIAKRYNVTSAEILERNGIDESELSSKRVLVIPAARKAPGFSRVI